IPGPLRVSVFFCLATYNALETTTVGNIACCGSITRMTGGVLAEAGGLGCSKRYGKLLKEM
ncbi:MAG: hypothetical protein OSA43_08720, partial [Pirellulales bacterium]|nr:hypothetical protein [Pirellulales bacterium]